MPASSVELVITRTLAFFACLFGSHPHTSPEFATAFRSPGTGLPSAKSPPICRGHASKAVVGGSPAWDGADSSGAWQDRQEAAPLGMGGEGGGEGEVRDAEVPLKQSRDVGVGAAALWDAAH